MTKLEQLIEQLCPNGVEHKSLGEIAEYSKARIPITNITVDEYIGVENLLQNKTGRTTAASLPNTDVVIAFERDDILIGNIRPYLRKIWLADCNGGTNGDVLTIHINDKTIVIPQFLYYVLSSEKFFFYDIQNSKGAKMPRGDKAAVMRYVCPIPPLEVQTEIVRILDKFTELTTELTTKLTTELTNRKKQYEYYRNNLLTFNTNVEMKKLKDVSDSIASGKNKNRSESGKYPVYGSTGIIAKTNVPVFSKKQILVARVGANAGYVHIADGEYDVSDNTLIIDIKTGYSIKYIYHYLVNKSLNQFAKGGGQPLITAGQLKELQLPVPNIEVQERIVNVLDNFEAICCDLNIGLPAEIEARQKQYEYYRDKLLTFKEVGTSET